MSNKMLNVSQVIFLLVILGALVYFAVTSFDLAGYVCSSVLLLGLFTGIIRSARHNSENIHSSSILTEEEKTVLIRQLIAGTVSAILPWPVIIMAAIFTLDSRVATFIVLMTVYPFVGYISASSIRNKISILKGPNDWEPVRGKQAVTCGILVISAMIAFVILLLLISYSLADANQS